MAMEIGSFPINSMVMFHSYVNIYQRVLSYPAVLAISASTDW